MRAVLLPLPVVPPPPERLRPVWWSGRTLRRHSFARPRQLWRYGAQVRHRRR